MRPVDRLKTLLDPERLAVAGALAVTSPRTLADLADHTGLADGRLRSALTQLATAKLVRSAEGGFVLDASALREIAAELVEVDLPMDPVIGDGMTDDEREVLARFFEGCTLTRIPVSRPKRLIVLERLALEFDLGRHYAETEVDEVLGAFHPDSATLRRYLVEEGMLDRDSRPGTTTYWRSGGRTDT